MSIAFKSGKIKNGGVMAQKKASLACAECGSRNYSINVSSTPKPTRLEVNKFCKHCKKYTLHKETR
ncbi:ribosomal protein L33 [Streptococcus vestibularis ATCC 49124]|nr:ribosomal protein L33 [Streptococcus vestibularis ATCC 49124]